MHKKEFLIVSKKEKFMILLHKIKKDIYIMIIS